MDSHVKTGDCLDLLSRMEDASVRLIYLDPPFFTQKFHSLYARDRETIFSFRDLWPSLDEYGKFLIERLQQCRRVLDKKGSVFFIVIVALHTSSACYWTEYSEPIIFDQK